MQTQGHCSDDGRVRARRRLSCETRWPAPSTPRDRRLAVWLSALSLAGLSRPSTGDARAEDDAEAAARSWLELVDAGRYAESWDDAAPLLKDVVAREKWEQALGFQRSALGRCPSRTRTLRKLVDALPGAPEGPYAVIQFETEFERKKNAVETVTPARGEDGSWRVSGYSIR